VTELAHRKNNGLEVTLLWDSETNHVAVEVVDELAGEAFTLPVPGSNALDAFYHPYAYAQL